MPPYIGVEAPSRVLDRAFDLLYIAGQGTSGLGAAVDCQCPSRLTDRVLPPPVPVAPLLRESLAERGKTPRAPRAHLWGRAALAHAAALRDEGIIIKGADLSHLIPHGVDRVWASSLSFTRLNINLCAHCRAVQPPCGSSQFVQVGDKRVAVSSDLDELRRQPDRRDAEERLQLDERTRKVVQHVLIP
eukprot:scaffold15918_cov73-Phaeocystis_antarctica.AAC.5